MLKLTFDVTQPGTASLIPLDGSIASLQSLRQGRHQVEIRMRQPIDGSVPGATAYEAAPTTGYLGVRIGVWSDSTGTLDDSSDYLLALTPHDQLTYNTDDSTDPYYEGTLDLFTTEIATAIGSAKSFSAYFAAGFVRDDLNIEPIFDHNGAATCTIYSATDDASGTLPTAALPGYRAITLPVYFKSVDGLRHYVLDENAGQTAVEFSPYTPP